MRINSQSWERAVPGYHTQTSSLTSTGRTGGHGWGDYVSAEARTETRSEKKEKKNLHHTKWRPELNATQKETITSTSVYLCWSSDWNWHPSWFWHGQTCTIVHATERWVSLSRHVGHIWTPSFPADLTFLTPSLSELQRTALEFLNQSGTYSFRHNDVVCILPPGGTWEALEWVSEHIHRKVQYNNETLWF